VPSAPVRYAGEAAFLILVAFGLGLAGFDPIVIASVLLVAVVLVALLERASAKAARRVYADQEEPASPPHVERVDDEAAAQQAVPAEPVQRPEPEPEPAVSERSARAILASAPRPMPKEESKARAAPPTPPPREPEPEPEPAVSGPPREWNLWELQRAVRHAADDDRDQEWSALLIHLREFANADGDLPLEFDGLVRESFGPLLVRSAEPAATS
jgi:hypothetical protein